MLMGYDAKEAYMEGSEVDGRDLEVRIEVDTFTTPIMFALASYYSHCHQGTYW